MQDTEFTTPSGALLPPHNKTLPQNLCERKAFPGTTHEKRNSCIHTIYVSFSGSMSCFHQEEAFLLTSCLQLSFFAYSCVWELLCLQLELSLVIGAFLLTIEAFLFTVGKCV